MRPISLPFCLCALLFSTLIGLLFGSVGFSDGYRSNPILKILRGPDRISFVSYRVMTQWRGQSCWSGLTTTRSSEVPVRIECRLGSGVDEPYIHVRVLEVSLLPEVV